MLNTSFSPFFLLLSSRETWNLLNLERNFSVRGGCGIPVHIFLRADTCLLLCLEQDASHVGSMLASMFALWTPGPCHSRMEQGKLRMSQLDSHFQEFGVGIQRQPVTLYGCNTGGENSNSGKASRERLPEEREETGVLRERRRNGEGTLCFQRLSRSLFWTF